MDILGKALMDYIQGHIDAQLLVNTSYGEIETMPVHTFFRTENDLPLLEQYALNLCSGKVLDVGAGAGSHSLLLQKKGLQVYALDISPLAVKVMRERGVKNAVCGDIFEFSASTFDTILLLMNGIGLAGNLQKLPELLSKFKKLLKPGGQLLLDSCDVSYLAEDNRNQSGYVGEITYQFEYNHVTGEPFGWLYLDAVKLKSFAKQAGWNSQIIYEDETGQYLARLTVR